MNIADFAIYALYLKEKSKCKPSIKKAELLLKLKMLCCIVQSKNIFRVG
jgi:hypothetical protein